LNILEIQPCQRFPESIECQKAGIKARRINPLLPHTHDILNCFVYVYKLQEAAVAEIWEELNPKTYRLDENSLLDLGAMICGRIIECISTKPIRRPRIKANSSRHRGQFSEASGYAYCKVISRYYDIP